jgi:hypothetical protein
MKAEVLSPQDPRWSEMLGRVRHDFYHLPHYLELCARHEGGKPVAFYAEEDGAAFLAPMLIQDVPDTLGVPTGWLDAATPYGYPSPLLVAADDLLSLDHFLGAFQEAAVEQEIITAFFRLHPLLPLPQDTLTKYGELVLHGQTVSIDLSLSPEDFSSQMRRNHRSDVQKLKRSGFEPCMDRWDLLDEFITIYLQTMKRLSADEFYFFSRDYFLELRTVLGDSLHLCAVLAPTGEVAAAGLFTIVDGIVQYHLSAANEQYLHQAPSKLIVEHAYHWAKEAGGDILHIGGGLGGREDSLFRYKAGFSKSRHDYFTYRMVLDEEKDATLTAARKELDAWPEEGTDFFPLYRYPVLDDTPGDTA